MDLLTELKERELFNNVTNETYLIEAFKNKSFFYIGIDPTFSSLHLGHYQNINLIKILMKYNLKPIIVIGGATGVIGDPSGKKEERQLLSKTELSQNVLAITEQIKGLLKTDIKIINNYDWYKEMDVFTFLIDIGKKINVNYILSKDSIKARISTGISYTEFSYILLQSYDFKYLYNIYNKNKLFIQIGGSDQWGNITSGLELIRKEYGTSTKAVGLTINLLTDKSGNKFGKSDGNPIWLDINRTTNYDLYQFIFNLDDEMVFSLLKRLTDLNLNKISDIQKKHLENKTLRIAQNELAKILISQIHSEQKYYEAIKISKSLFENTFTDLEKKLFLKMIHTIPTFKIESNKTILNSFEDSGFIKSRREIREAISLNTLKINNKEIDNENFILKKEDSLHSKYFIVQLGKKKRFLFELK